MYLTEKTTNIKLGLIGVEVEMEIEIEIEIELWGKVV